MAKTKNNWSDVVVVLLIFLVLATNTFWLLAVRDINDRVDRVAEKVNTLSTKVDNQ